MMWLYHQSSGKLLTPAGVLAGVCYSGHDVGMNNPAMQHVPRIGPIPQGFYSIGEPHDTDSHGPYVMALTPFPENVMFGRDGFLMHGDSKLTPGSASLGCIVAAPGIRHLVGSALDKCHLLEVIE